MKFLILNGPNLNLLGIREPGIYGTQDYAALEALVRDTCREIGAECELFQSNHEGALVDRIGQALLDERAGKGKTDGIVINPAAYTHTSVAILDALKAVNIPTVEVHISDPSQRELFRRFSYVSLAAEKTISGHGLEGYREAILWLSERLTGVNKK